MWEYKVIRGSPDEKALNELGAQGWELVGVGNESFWQGTGMVFLIFKRRKQ